MVTRSSLVGLGLGLALLFPGESRANGAFPAVSQLVVDPSDPAHLVLRSNFGLLVSRDAGASWGWICEGSLGYLDIEPPIAIAPGGATLLALPTGVAVVEPSGCNFQKATGIDANVTDLSVELAKENAILAVSVNLETNSSQVWESLDGGASFSTLGGAIGSFSALTIDAAKTDGERLYLSGMSAGAAPRGILLTSFDHGQSWQASVVPNSDRAQPPYIAALHPSEADTVYVRTNGFPGSLVITRDGGKTFVEALSLPAPVQGFAISPDGSTLLASTVTSGIFRASAETLEFERLTCDGVSCLSWSETGLFGCGDQATNGFTLGVSADLGASFRPVVNSYCIEPLSCPADSSFGKVCPAAWPMVSQALEQNTFECDASAPSRPFDSSCLPGQGGVDGGGGEPGTGAGTAGEPNAHAGAPSTPNGEAGEPAIGGRAPGGAPPSSTSSRQAESGCGCKVGGSRATTPLYLFAALLLLARRRHALLTLFVTAGCSNSPVDPIHEPYVGDPFPNRRAPLELPRGDFGLTSNNGSDTVSALALQEGDALATAPVGLDPVALDGPHHVAVSRELGVAFVALAYPAPAVSLGPHAAHGGSQRRGFVQALSLTDLSPLAHREVSTNPGDIVLSDDGSRLVVSHFELNRAQRAPLALLDPSKLGEPVMVSTCVAPHAVALSRPSGETAYVACYGEDALAIVDLTAPEATPELVPLGPGTTPGRPIYGPYAALLSNDGARVAVSNTESNDVRWFDTDARAFEDLRLVTPGKPYFVAWSADDTSLFVPTQNPDTLLIVDAKSALVNKTRVFTTEECQLPHEAVFGSDPGVIFVVCEGDHVAPSVVLALNATTLETERTFPVGVYPDRLAIAREAP